MHGVFGALVLNNSVITGADEQRFQHARQAYAYPFRFFLPPTFQGYLVFLVVLPLVLQLGAAVASRVMTERTEWLFWLFPKVMGFIVSAMLAILYFGALTYPRGTDTLTEVVLFMSLGIINTGAAVTACFLGYPKYNEKDPLGIA